jgi:hypothetical protein
MSSPALEACLARLYADKAALARFLDDPDAVLRASGLDPGEQAALAAIDRTGLIMAARSFAAKRSGRAKGHAAGRVRRVWATLFR